MELQIELKGKKEIVTTDWQLQIAKGKAVFEALDIKHFKNEEERKDAFKLQKKIVIYRDYIKQKIKDLDDVAIARLREELLVFDRLLTSKNGDIDRAIKKWKEDEKDRQIDEGFSLVLQQPNFKVNRECYRVDFLVEIKGKTLDKFFEEGQKLASKYSDVLENKQLKFDKVMYELKTHCKEIDYNIPENYLEVLSKKTIENSFNIVEDIEKTKIILKSQKDKADEIIRQKEEPVEVKTEQPPIVNKTIDNNDVDNDKMLEITKILKSPEIFHVISEPGDMTRYDFMIIKNYDDYLITPFKSTFRFPQRINIWDIKNKKIYNDKIAEDNNCNPCTVKAVVDAIKKIEEDNNK